MYEPPLDLPMNFALPPATRSTFPTTHDAEQKVPVQADIYALYGV
jgi:hypothetical protein